MRFPVEIVRRLRAAVGQRLHPRVPALDARPRARTAAPGTRWSRSPGRSRRRAPRSSTPASAGTRRGSPPSRRWCPRAAFTWVTRRLRGEVKVPLVTTNRINDPAVAEAVLARGDADVVSMARPFLADAELVTKAAAGRAAEINTCIACNQACLDHIFEGKVGVVPREPARLPRDRAAARAGARRRGGSRSSARVPPASPARAPRPSAATASRSSRRPPRSAGSSTSPGASPARRSTRRRCGTSARASPRSASTSGSARPPPPRASPRRPTIASSSRRASRRASPPSPASTTRA